MTAGTARAVLTSPPSLWNLPPLFSRDRNFIFIEGRRQHRYSKEFVSCLRINSTIPTLEHLEPLVHSDPYGLWIAPYRRFLHKTQLAEIWFPIGWYIIGGGIPVFIKIHRAAEFIHPIRRLSHYNAPGEQSQRTEDRNDCHEYGFHGSPLSFIQSKGVNTDGASMPSVPLLPPFFDDIRFSTDCL